MAIGIQANKFSILYIVNQRHYTTEHKNQQLWTLQQIDAKMAVKYLYQKLPR
jgi:hypothetical protein